MVELVLLTRLSLLLLLHGHDELNGAVHAASHLQYRPENLQDFSCVASSTRIAINPKISIKINVVVIRR